MAEWPDEEAKKYYFDKPLRYPGSMKQPDNGRSDFEINGRFSGYFRESASTIVPYEARNPGRPPQLSADEEKK